MSLHVQQVPKERYTCSVIRKLKCCSLFKGIRGLSFVCTQMRATDVLYWLVIKLVKTSKVPRSLKFKFLFDAIKSCPIVFYNLSTIIFWKVKSNFTDLYIQVSYDKFVKILLGFQWSIQAFRNRFGHKGQAHEGRRRSRTT